MIRPELAQSFAQLEAHRADMHDYTIAELFKSNPHRFSQYHITLDDLLFDFSKHRITDQTLSYLTRLAQNACIESLRNALFAGEKINKTEHRPALHMALRQMSDEPLYVDGANIISLIRAERARVDTFAHLIRTHEIRGATGKPLTHIINIGIGGSDLGPAMAARALSPFVKEGIKLHFVSNVDGADLADTLKNIDLSTVLFIVSSKTFTTQETMANANAARSLIVKSLGEEAVGHHFCAVSTKLDLVAQFGISPERTFGFWDWVGGRYSLWSAISLALTIGIGSENMRQFLMGGHDVDEHFITAPLNKNIPVVMGLLGIWYRNIWGYNAHAVIPYDQRLARFPAYLQQLDMESNGKSVTNEGKPTLYATAPLVWGEPGTNGQHAFFQMLHQGTDIIPIDFIVAAQSTDADSRQHELLFANCLAQSEALMMGRSSDETEKIMRHSSHTDKDIDLLVPHKTFAGNRPSSTLLYSALTPRNLGRLVALYEHKVFVQSVIWDINPFDQWGVELGKEMCGKLVPFVEHHDRDTSDLNQSTAGLINHRRIFTRR
jgi:glucose-6-phosphate isomerase